MLICSRPEQRNKFIHELNELIRIRETHLADADRIRGPSYP